MIDESHPEHPVGDQKALGRAIRVLREREHLTPTVLANRAEIDLETLEQTEAGKGDLDWNTIVHLARAMGVSMEEVSELHEEFVREEEQDAQ